MRVFILSENAIIRLFFLFILSGLFLNVRLEGQNLISDLHYTVSMKDPANHLFQVEMECRECNIDTIDFRMPQWMPGYYQIMNYWREVSDFYAMGNDGKTIIVNKMNDNTWRIISPGKDGFCIKYNVKAEKKFVANNFLDSTHGYIIPAATFMYI